jgi:hypothetical protein
MPLADRHDVAQALGLDRPDEALGVGVEVRATRGQAQHLHVARSQDLFEAVEADTLERGLDLALHRIVEVARSWIGTQQRHVEERARALRARGIREGEHGVVIDGAECLARSRLLDRRAKATECDVWCL